MKTVRFESIHISVGQHLSVWHRLMPCNALQYPYSDVHGYICFFFQLLRIANILNVKTFFLKMSISYKSKAIGSCYAFVSHLPCLYLTHMGFYHATSAIRDTVMLKGCSSLVDRLVCLLNISQSHSSQNGHTTLTVMLSNISLGLSCC